MINDCLCVKKFSKVHMGRYVDILKYDFLSYNYLLLVWFGLFWFVLGFFR